MLFIFSDLHSFAYIEFSDRDSVQSAIGLHETLFRGRVLKVREYYAFFFFFSLLVGTKLQLFCLAQRNRLGKLYFAVCTGHNPTSCLEVKIEHQRVLGVFSVCLFNQISPNQ